MRLSAPRSARLSLRGRRRYDGAVGGPVWRIGERAFDCSERTLVMGILNVTPDSFSDGGRFFGEVYAARHAVQMVADGADVIDVGGESTRPGSDPVPVEEELARVLPVIGRLVDEAPGVPISIDTRKAEVAAAALDAGASIVNDVSGGADPAMFDVVREREAAIVLMHMKGDPKTMQEAPAYDDVVAEVRGYLRQRVEAAAFAGIEAERIAIDPGIGFGKDLEHNLTLMNRIDALLDLGRPVLVGPSRKRFIGTILDLPEDERDEGSVGAVALAGLARRPRGPRARRPRGVASRARDRRDREGRPTVSDPEKRRVRTSGGELAVVRGRRPRGPRGRPASRRVHVLAPVAPPRARCSPRGCTCSRSTCSAPATRTRRQGADLSLEGHARSVRELLEHLGVERFAVVGHGHGGGVAQLLALGGGADAIVLIDSVAFEAWPAAPIRELRDRGVGARPRRRRGLAPRHARPGDVPPRAALRATDRDGYLRPFAGPDGVERFTRILASFDGRGLVGIEPWLAELQIPALDPVG